MPPCQGGDRGFKSRRDRSEIRWWKLNCQNKNLEKIHFFQVFILYNSTIYNRFHVPFFAKICSVNHFTQSAIPSPETQEIGNVTNPGFNISTPFLK